MVFNKTLPNRLSAKSKWGLFGFILHQQIIIFSKIWWQVVLVTLYALTLVSLNYFYYGDGNFYFTWSASLVPILGVVTGLLLVFRTNTAYDRYYEGRRLWSQMTQGIRILTRSVWVVVPEDSGQAVVEKKTVTNFLVAYAIASKHYLREEYSYEHKDLKDLIHHFPQLFSEPRSDLLRRLTVLNYAPPSNIPSQILYYIAIFAQTLKIRHKWDAPTTGLFYNALNSLVECLSGFERIKRTPIPPAYSVHLNHVIWLYILTLPFQLVESMGWWTIAGVAITSFTFLGILEIGSQIEDPFGYDDNDLPLDDLCDVLVSELDDILRDPFPTHEELFLSSSYFPIPGCQLSSADLALMTEVEVRTFLKLHSRTSGPKPSLVHLNNVKVVS